jgi:CRISPR-associated protein Csx3
MAIKNSFLPTDVRGTYKGIVVAVGGPPHSGKSVFLAELYRQLLAIRPASVFLQRACPDGEGMWSAESDPAVVKEIRRKGSFSREFMLFTLKAIENLGKRFPIILIDLGGRRTAENAEILKRSTHLIILSSKEEENELWQQFAKDEGCETLAVFGSRLVKRSDDTLDDSVRSSLDVSSEIVKGEMLNLDREDSAEPYRGAMTQFASWLVAEVENR